MSLSPDTQDRRPKLSEMLQATFVMFLVLLGLLYWVGDYNEYVVIGFRKYVASPPRPMTRFGYSFAISLIASLAFIAVLLALALVRPRFGWPGFLSFSITFTVILFLFADLNGYVIGHGPDGEDWVKIEEPWGILRLLVCAAGGTFPGLLAWVLTPSRAPAGTKGERHGTGMSSI